MILHIVRHAIAHDRDPDRWPDDRDRPLTPEGEERFRAAARGLRRLVDPPELVLSSRLARAWRTAELLEEEAGWPEPVPMDELEPERPPGQAAEGLAGHAGRPAVAVVGHDPHLSSLASLLLCGDVGGVEIELKKGGLIVLGFDGRPGPGAAVLRWAATPKLLRAAG